MRQKPEPTYTTIADGINARGETMAARAVGATVRITARPDPRGQSRGVDDILPWARYCAATSRRRAARRAGRPGRR